METAPALANPKRGGGARRRRQKGTKRTKALWPVGDQWPLVAATPVAGPQRYSALRTGLAPARKPCRAPPLCLNFSCSLPARAPLLLTMACSRTAVSMEIADALRFEAKLWFAADTRSNVHLDSTARV